MTDLLRDLIERLQAAKGPDRDIDAAIFKAVTNQFASIPVPPGISVPRFTESAADAFALLPWREHPGATFTVKVIQSGVGSFYSWAELTWPSTEVQGRGLTMALATTACAVGAILRTHEDMAPYRKRTP